MSRQSISLTGPSAEWLRQKVNINVSTEVTVMRSMMPYEECEKRKQKLTLFAPN